MALTALAGTTWAQAPAPAVAPWNQPAAPAPAARPATPPPPAAATPPAQTAPAPQAAPAASPAPAPSPAPAARAPASPSPGMVTTTPPVFADEDFLVGEAHYKAKNYQDAYLRLLPAAHRGHTQAQYLLGQMAEYGVGPVRRSMAEALRWYRLAAAKEHAESQFAISNAYANGYGVQIDAQQAVIWLRRAAENGLHVAMIAIAAIYDYGRGVPADPAEGSKWIKRAAELGGVDATYQYARRLETGFGVEKNEPEAQKWYRRAADRGHPGAQLRLGTVADPTASSPEENIAAYTWLQLALQRATGALRAAVQEKQQELQRNMTPTDVAEATSRVRVWRQAPQAPGLRPDPEYDAPPVASGAAPGAARGAGGG